jgi:hypothetical protein
MVGQSTFFIRLFQGDFRERESTKREYNKRVITFYTVSLTFYKQMFFFLLSIVLGQSTTITTITSISAAVSLVSQTTSQSVSQSAILTTSSVAAAINSQAPASLAPAMVAVNPPAFDTASQSSTDGVFIYRPSSKNSANTYEMVTSILFFCIGFLAIL